MSHSHHCQGNTTNILAGFQWSGARWCRPSLKVSSSGWYHGPSQSRLSQLHQWSARPAKRAVCRRLGQEWCQLSIYHQ
jgi:hypothetical protein